MKNQGNRAEADRQREVILADAYREAQKFKGEGDSAANAAYAEAFGKDPQFAEFWRSLDAWRASVGQQGDVLVIDPAASDFFKGLQAGPAVRP